MPSDEQERLRRWRLILGGDSAASANGRPDEGTTGIDIALGRGDQAIDRALAALYNPER